MSEHATATNGGPTPALQMNPEGDPKAFPIVWIGILGIIHLVTIVIALEAFYYQIEHDEEVTKLYAAQPVQLMAQRSAQLANLHTPRWVDKEHGIATMPIDDAVERVIRDWSAGRKPPLPPIPPPKPAVAPAPTPAASTKPAAAPPTSTNPATPQNPGGN